MTFKSFLLFAVAATTGLVSACDANVLPDENEPPVARLLFPQLWPVQEAAPFDASDSFDFDGDLVRITMNFGDGTPEISLLDGVFEHAYPAAGSFEVRLEVEDDAGERAEVLGTVVIADRVDDPGCSCGFSCLDDGVCDRDLRRWFLGGQSEDPDDIGGPPVPPNVLNCADD